MKQVWICKWEVAPGDGEQTLCFATLEEAKAAMRQKMTEYIDLADIMDELQPETAQFLSKYLSDPSFPQTQEECPNIFEELEDPENDVYGEIIMNSGCVSLEYPYGIAPQLHTNLVLDKDQDDIYRLNFWYDGLWKKTHNGINSMSFYIRRAIDYGTSAYPVLILLALRKTPATQKELIDRIAAHWAASIDRKTVSRHLKLLEDMGYAIHHNEHGYYYEGENADPKPGMKFTPNTYPLLVLEVLDTTPKTMDAMVREIYQRYGAKVDRKAVSRHLTLLKAVGFSIERTKGGYRMQL